MYFSSCANYGAFLFTGGRLKPVLTIRTSFFGKQLTDRVWFEVQSRQTGYSFNYLINGTKKKTNRLMNLISQTKIQVIEWKSLLMTDFVSWIQACSRKTNTSPYRWRRAVLENKWLTKEINIRVIFKVQKKIDF